jgi:Skp family chaperone for outer membrane proteins
MKENDLSIIFDKKNIFIAKSDSNITTDIINLINDKFK